MTKHHYQWTSLLGVGVILLLFAAALMVDAVDQTSDLPVSAPINTDSAGKGGLVALRSVVRVICPSMNSAGTGFLHKSGLVVTAQHVVAGCSDAVVLAVSGATNKVSKIAQDAELDLALLTLTMPIKAPVLPLSKDTRFSIGLQVSTWGFPGGYNSRVPLLSVGYLAGIEDRKTLRGKTIRQWVVNAAFNRGNSGGPLVNIETGKVIGVVSSKLAPIPRVIKSALEALKKQKSGFMYTATRPDGTKVKFSEGQVIAQVLEHLRAQVQLVVGKAVVIEDLRNFIKAQGIKP